MNLCNYKPLAEELLELRRKNKPVAAICAAPMVLGRLGILKGKRATIYDGMKDVRLAMLGFGNAGQAFARLLCDKQKEINGKYGCGVIVTAIATRTKGTIIDDSGIDLDKACRDVVTSGHFGHGVYQKQAERFCTMGQGRL